MSHKPEDRKKLIDEIRKFPQELQKEIAGLQPDQLDYRPGPDEWSIRQVVHHLADSHMNAFMRTKLLLTETNPTIKPYDQEAWARQPDYEERVDFSLDILHGLHNRWVTLFESLSLEDWHRTGQHPESGEISPDWLVEHYAWHGQNHLEQIRRNKRALGLEGQQ